MKSNLKKQGFTLGFLAALAGFALMVMMLQSPVVAVHAQAATLIQSKITNTTLSVSLANASVNAGDAFDFSLNVSTDTPTRGFQAQVNFDPKLMEVSACDEGSFYKDWANANNASTAMIPGPSPDNSKGVIPLFAVIVTGGTSGQGPFGDGTLVTCHAKAKPGASGQAAISLSDVIISDAGNTAGAPSPFAGVKIQEAIVGIGGPAPAQPTAYALSNATAIPTPGSISTSNSGQEATAIRRNASAESGSTGLGIWVIIIPLVVAGLLGLFVLLTRKKKS